MTDEPTRPAVPPPTVSTPPPEPSPSATTARRSSTATSVTIDNRWALGLAATSVFGVLLGLLVRSSTAARFQVRLWDTMGWTWSLLAIFAAVAVLAATVSGLLPLSRLVRWQVACAAAGILGLWWVLLVLPYVELTSGFLATVGVLAGGAAAWLSRPADES